MKYVPLWLYFLCFQRNNIIYIDEDLPPHEQTFVWAHELGHYSASIQLTNVASLSPTQQRILTLFESLGIPSYLCTNAIIRIGGNKKEEEVIDALENVLRLVGPLVECNTKSNTKLKNP